MTTASLPRRPAPRPPAPRFRPEAVGVRRVPRRWLAGVVVAVWLLLWLALRGHDTLLLSPADLTPLHRHLTQGVDAVGRSRQSAPLLTHLVDPVRRALDSGVGAALDLVARPSGTRPVPQVGWLGVLAGAGYLAAALAGLRAGLLTVAGLTLVGLQGLWAESMSTLALTLCAVALALVVGIPLGLWAGVSDRVRAVVMPVLDLLQTLPTLVYLAPLTLLFLIGPAAATIATLVYALPPVVRLTAYGVREVPRPVLEATTSLGATGGQRLRTVLLPLARRSVVLGVNQTMMAALSMATVAALIDAPGLGRTVLRALQTLDVGVAANAGLAIVVLAVVLDRTTSAAGRRAGQHAGGRSRLRRPALLVGAGLVVVAVVLSRTYLWAARFPGHVRVAGRPFDVGAGVAGAASSTSSWLSDHVSGLTGAVKDLVTLRVLNPLEQVLTTSPWWVVLAALTALAALTGGRRAAAVAGGGLALLVVTGVWHDAMTTLASTVLATLAVLAVGVAVGVAMGRSRRTDAVLRPLLDAGQTLPAFVYLVPFLALFSASRFTAVLAAVVFAAPAVVKIVADGVRAVPVATVEAATALGCTRWQTVTGVQLPLARRALAVAANQGVVYVLSMIVVGGLVGAGALGYDIVAGFSQSQLSGKGLAAGLAVVLLGVVLDQVTQAAARRAEPVPRR